MAEEKAKHPGGRPSKHTPEMIARAEDYLENWHKKPGIVVPSQVGLAIHCNLALSTVQAWGEDEDKPKFSGIYKRVGELQHEILVNNGLVGTFTPAITKLMLTKHKYSDHTKSDNTTEHSGTVTMASILQGSDQGGIPGPPK